MILKPLNDIKLIEKVRKLSKGHKVYLVGGCVRDWLMDQKSLDMDFVFDFYPEKIAQEISNLYGGNFRKFEKFLTIRIFIGNRRLDFACFRKEKYPKPAVLPVIEKAKTIEEDLKRRDFTANAIAISLNKKNLFEVIDPFNGIRDINAKILRTLHKNSFRDDPTRIFRAARFASRFGWKIDKDIERQIKQALNKNYVLLLSRERIRNEIIKILEEEKSFIALKFLEKWKVLQRVCPELKLKKEVDLIKNWEMKLAFLSAISEDANAFLKSLHLEKKIYNIIYQTIKPHLIEKAPSFEPTPQQKLVFKLLNPSKNEISFSKVLVSNSDLNRLKINPFLWNKIISEIAALQWEGKIKTKKQALKIAKNKKWKSQHIDRRIATLGGN